MECVNLKERFGKKYRVTYEESYYAERPEYRQAEAAWLQNIPCRHGHIFPHGGKLLAASVDGHPIVANMLRRLRCCRVHQDGDFGELTVVFDAADFDQVAKIMQPRRRRQVSETERERLRAIGFHSNVQSDLQPRQCVGRGLDDSQAVQGQTDAKLALSSAIHREQGQ